jgi:hypothetical protein
MEMRIRLIPGSLLLLVACFFSVRSDSRPQSQTDASPTLIVPGMSVGPLQLGDTRERAVELFPNKPNMDQEWRERAECGTTINWLDMKNHQMAGNVFIRLKEDRVFQIDAGATSFHTAKNITMKSSPQEIRREYPGLRAYVISTGSSEASGGRPLVYWVDSEKGIAFAFAYSRSEKKRYLNWIIVFKPHAEICPQWPDMEPIPKRELPAYSLESE